MVRVAGVEPAWTCAQDMWVAATLHPDSLREGLSALPDLPLYTYNLAERVHHVHQIALRFHHGVNGLVRHWCFVNDVRVLSTLDGSRRLRVIVQREAALRFRT